LKKASSSLANFFLALLVFTLLSPPLCLPASEFQFSTENLQFLDQVERAALDFFLNEHHPNTGLVKDRADNFSPDHNTIASIASTGFGLTSMVVGAERGWIPREEAQKYCEKTLKFFLEQMETEHGFYYHFVRWDTGARVRGSELSSIDTAIFTAGALTAGIYFKGTPVEGLANRIYERIDFPWMLNHGKTLSLGWDPAQQKFLNRRWNDYNESFILYLLAIGSPTHPVPATSWREVNKRIGIYGDYTLIYSPPLFTHQFPQVWADLRNKNDGFADYFENSRIATIVNRLFCLDHRNQFKTYSENSWGLTASDGPGGYRAYGSGPGSSNHDGTVAPTAVGSSIVFTPELSLGALKSMYENHKKKIWGKYGFSDSFNLDRDWFDRDVLGIDQGPLLLMIENARSGLIWKLFMKHTGAVRGMARMEFRPGTLRLEPPKRPQLKLVGSKASLNLVPARHRELGDISGPSDLQGTFSFWWDKRFLYVTAKVLDDSIITRRKNGQIWRDDLLELFIDPQGDGFRWGDPKDVQIGLSPSADSDQGRSWVWPKNFDPVKAGAIELISKRHEDGYTLYARIAWGLLGIRPKPGFSFGFTPALHDIDADGSEGKLVWFFLPDGKTDSNILGEAVLDQGR